MYEGVAKLKKYGPTTYDKYGNPITPKEERKVFVQPRGVYASEFYSAAQIGLKPSITFDIANRADYHGEIAVDHYGRKMPKKAHGSENFPEHFREFRDGLEAILSQK